jgi:hypothetical protein
LYLVSDYIQSAGKGTCYVCRAHRRSRDEIVLDFGRDIEFEGALQVCAPCIAEAAKLTGAIGEANDALAAELALERQRRIDAEAMLDVADKALDALGIYAAKPRKLRVEDESLGN